MNKKNYTIALDVDGVVANFIEGVRDITSCWNLPEPTDWDNFLPKFMPPDMFWNDVYTKDFFYNAVPKYAWADELVEKCSEYNLFFLTSCCQAVRSKSLWLQRHFPKVPAVYCDRVEKTYIKYDVLIDDDPRKAGWPGVIQFPASYNKGTYSRRGVLLAGTPEEFVREFDKIIARHLPKIELSEQTI